jgi:DNA-binding response OmpR family regulator
MISSKTSSFSLDAWSTRLAHGLGEYRGNDKSKGDASTARREDQNLKPSQYKVLVVDDEAPMRELIVRLLSWKGHRCVTACNGLEALKIVEEEKIDAVVTDIVMPEMNGIALTRELSKKSHRLPIMVLTGHSKEYPEEAALDAGAREFIGKPFSIEEFLLRFHKMMRDHEAAVHTEARTNRMIFNLRQEYSEEVKEAKKETEKLRGRLYAPYMSPDDY